MTGRIDLGSLTRAQYEDLLKHATARVIPRASRITELFDWDDHVRVNFASSVLIPKDTYQAVIGDDLGAGAE